MEAQPHPDPNHEQTAAAAALATILKPLPSLEQLARSTLQNTPPDTLKPSASPPHSPIPEPPPPVQPTPSAVKSSVGAQHDANKPATMPVAKTKKGKRKSQNAQNPPCKRPRSQKHSLEAVRNEIAKSAQALRKIGVVPSTLFFPALPTELEGDVELRSAIGVTLEHMKTIHVNGKKMAWLTFSSESECLDTLLSLRTSYPNLKVSLHKLKKTDATGMTPAVKNAQIFDDKVKGVLQRGGIGNSLLFRNLPIETDCDELNTVFCELLQDVTPACRPLGIRTAVSRTGQSRNFWTVHSDQPAAKRAFVTLFLKHITFRCGKSAKLHPIVHDDASDSDTKKRRQRATALGVHHSNGNNQMNVVATLAPVKTSLDLLEDYLRQTRQTLFFINDS